MSRGKAETTHTPTKARSEFLRQADSIVAQMIPLSIHADALPISNRTIEFPILDMLRVSTALVIANVLDGSSASLQNLQLTKGMIYSMREWWTAQIFGRSAASILMQTTETYQYSDALIVIAADNHFANIHPVTAYLKSAIGIRNTWLPFRERYIARLRETNENVFTPLRCKLTQQRTWQLIRIFIEKLKSATEIASNHDIELSVWHDLTQHLEHHLRFSYLLAYSIAYSVIAAIERLRPKIVIVGNPCTHEGRIAAYIARAYGLPSITMQHGFISHNDTNWHYADVDRILCWGKEPYEELLRKHHPPEKLKIIGSPILDNINISTTQRREDSIILVALSGHGHMVGRQEHEADVIRILQAAQKMPNHRWVFRLHPKDHPAFYLQKIEEMRAATYCSVVPSSKALSIHQQLQDTSVLITVSSTVAVEAMIHRVPVITLGRNSLTNPSFVNAGATCNVLSGEDLVTALQNILSKGEDASISRNAFQYAQDFFGPMDGEATQRAAQEVVRLMRRE